MIELLHGDCLEEMKKIPDGSIDFVLTDPPYGTTACKWDTVIPFEPMWSHLKRVTKKNGAIVLFGSQPFNSALVMSNPSLFKYEWIWVKSKSTGFLDCKKKPLNNTEVIDVFSEGTPDYYPQMTEGKMHKNGGGTTGPANVYGAFSNRKQTETNLYYPKRTIEFKTEHGKHPTPTTSPQVCWTLPYSSVTETMSESALRVAEKVAVFGKSNVTWSLVTSARGAARTVCAGMRRIRNKRGIILIRIKLFSLFGLHTISSNKNCARCHD